MQYVVIAYDGTDAQAHERRMNARQAHLELMDAMKQKGKALTGMAILDEKENMIGSIVVTNFDSREECNDWLKREPYVTGKVWEKIEVKQVRIAPMFPPETKSSTSIF